MKPHTRNHRGIEHGTDGIEHGSITERQGVRRLNCGSLHDRAVEAFASMARALKGTSDATQRLRHTIDRARVRLHEPMRVAVAGRVGQGKSTLVNALLKQQVAEVVHGECTYAVTEFRYASGQTLVAHYQDGTSVPHTVEHLARLSVFDESIAGELARVRRLEYGLPAPLLRSFRLADTPGLDGMSGASPAEYVRALGRLGRDVADLYRESGEEMIVADGVLYSATKSLGAADIRLLDRFVDPSAVDALAPLTPLKAIGVLTRCDELAGADDIADQEPLVAGRAAVKDMLRDNPRLRRLMFGVVPVAAIVSAGAAEMTEEHLDWIRDLLTLPPSELGRQLRDVELFAGAGTARALPDRHRREALLRLLGRWGLYTACTYARQAGVGVDVAELRTRLDEASGVAELRRVMTEHFGRRAPWIKYDVGLRDVRDEVARCRDAALATPFTVLDRAAVDDVANQRNAARANEPAFAELAVLNAYYLGQLALRPGEIAKVERLVGLNGTTCAARLGLRPEASLDEMEAAIKARRSHWARRAALNAGEERAASTLRDLCDRLAERLQHARRLLDVDD